MAKFNYNHKSYVIDDTIVIKIAKYYISNFGKLSLNQQDLVIKWLSDGMKLSNEFKLSVINKNLAIEVGEAIRKNEKTRKIELDFIV